MDRFQIKRKELLEVAKILKLIVFFNHPTTVVDKKAPESRQWNEKVLEFCAMPACLDFQQVQFTFLDLASDIVVEIQHVWTLGWDSISTDTS